MSRRARFFREKSLDRGPSCRARCLCPFNNDHVVGRQRVQPDWTRLAQLLKDYSTSPRVLVLSKGGSTNGVSRL